MLLPPPHMLPGLSPAPVKQKKKQAKKRKSPHMLPELNPAPPKQKKKQAKKGKKEKKVPRPLQNVIQEDVLEVPESLISPQAAEYDRVYPTFSRRNLCQKTSSENSEKTVSASKSLSPPEPTNICSSEKGKETGNRMMTNSLVPKAAALGNQSIELPPVGNQPIEEAESSPPSSGKEHSTSPTKSYKMAQNSSEIMGKPESTTKSSTIDGVTLDDCSAVSLSDDEVIGKAKLCRDTLLNQARAIHPKHKELLVSAFVDFLRLCFSFNKNTSSTALEELADRAIDCASWGFNTNGALQRIRDFQVQREICNREKQVYDEKVAKLEKDISETLAMLEGLKAAQRALKEQGASISYGNNSSPEFEGAFLEHLEELVAELFYTTRRTISNAAWIFVAAGSCQATYKGKELQDGKWGSLDASLSFIGKNVYVAASSGFELHGIIHWCDVCACLVAYDPATAHSELLMQPPDPQEFSAFC